MDTDQEVVAPDAVPTDWSYEILRCHVICPRCVGGSNKAVCGQKILYKVESNLDGYKMCSKCEQFEDVFKCPDCGKYLRR